MVRELCVLPLGCQRGRGPLLTMRLDVPSTARFIASTMPTGPPPTMRIGVVIASTAAFAKPLGTGPALMAPSIAPPLRLRTTPAPLRGLCYGLPLLRTTP